MRKLYVGITGLAGAGKDYIADKMIEELEVEHFVWADKVPWALGVRKEIEEVLRTNVDALYEKPTSYEVRRLLQWWGTDFRRAQDPDYWVKKGIEAAEERYADVILFTDTRFPNEVDAIIDRNGLVFNIAAAPRVREERIGKTPKHASEELANRLPYDMRIWNNGLEGEGVPAMVATAVQLILDRKRGAR